MKQAKAGRMPVLKRIAAIGLVLLVMVVFFFVGRETAKRGGLPGESGEKRGRRDPGVAIFLDLFLGLFFGVAGALLYFLTMLTQCFTFSYQKPVFPGFRVKLYVVNIVFILCVALALGGLGHLVLTVISGIGGFRPVAFEFVMLLSICVSLFGGFFLGVWTPMYKPLIRKRLAALGIPDEYLDQGILTGISDPRKSSFTKVAGVADDIGMMWIRDDAIVYRGDSKEFSVHRPGLLEIERKADSGSLAAICGVMDIILRMLKNGVEQRVRLHPLGYWTPRALDDLAEKIEEWRVAGNQEPEERVPRGEEENV